MHSIWGSLGKRSDLQGLASSYWRTGAHRKHGVTGWKGLYEAQGQTALPNANVDGRKKLNREKNPEREGVMPELDFVP